MSLVKCPKCGETTDTARRGLFCDGCGERLPEADAFGADVGKRWNDSPSRRDETRRAFGGQDPPDEDYPPDDRNDVNRFFKGDSEAKKKAAWGVAGYLFAIAALQLICGGIVLFAMPQAVGAQGAPPEVLVFAVGLLVVLCLVFAGIGVWALKMPVVAGIVGLVLYVGINLLDLIDPAPGGFAFRGIIFKIIIIIGLIRAIIAAHKAQ